MYKNILNYTITELEDTFKKHGIPGFRARQVFRALHKRLVTEFGNIKEISSEVKTFLKENYSFNKLDTVALSESVKYDTKKFLFALPGSENRIETVLISEKERDTICVSTQVGCNVGCEFCATGKLGFKKNLDAADIVSQVYEISRQTGKKITNLVFMGMGEPFLNYGNLLTALKILTDEQGLNIPSGRITVSTVGFKDRIKKFADDISDSKNKKIKNIKLALSLHSTDNGVRESIIPTSKNNKLSDIYDEIIYFYRKTGNKITYEYIFFQGLNDSEEDIKRLAKLSRMVPSNINIIPFHPIGVKLNKPLDIYNKANKDEIQNDKLIEFISGLKSLKIAVHLRSSSGVDINAACGQLALRNSF